MSDDHDELDWKGVFPEDASPQGRTR